jgi:hypothetical protein
MILDYMQAKIGIAWRCPISGGRKRHLEFSESLSWSLLTAGSDGRSFPLETSKTGDNAKKP